MNYTPYKVTTFWRDLFVSDKIKEVRENNTPNHIK